MTQRNEDNSIDDIKNEIINILQIDEDENKDEIIDSLLKHGRQSLVNYEEDIIPNIYKKEMENNRSDLLESLKKYFQNVWPNEYGSSYNWFSTFLKNYQDVKNPEVYQNILRRTAEYAVVSNL